MAAARSRSRADDTKVKPRSDAYVGLMGLSLLALSAAMLFAFLMWQGISEKPLKQVQVAPAGGGARMSQPPMGGPAANPPGGAPMPPGAGNPAPPVPPAQPPAPPKQ